MVADLKKKTLEEIANERGTEVSTLQMAIRDHASGRYLTLTADEKGILKEA